ncbi:hypothetical protein [Streptomyces sp. NPDC056144]|uniref:hypothetical protein n=1 Tax=unclassified Streptomyces TaxID=2593676 RepID=UPI0035DF1B13
MTTSQSTARALALGGEDSSFWDKKRLERLRREMNGAALIGRSGGRVVLYVKTLPGLDPTAHFEELSIRARSQGWTVHMKIHDDGGGIQVDSEAWGELMAALRGGLAQGVLVPSFHHISMDTVLYANALKEIAELRCFTSLLVPEPST